MNYLAAINRHNQKIEYQNQEIKTFIDDYLSAKIDDQIMTLFIKSIYDQGLSSAKLAYLTKVMIDSGEVIDLSSIEGIKVDKHSTGGIGDKVSLILGPILASLGAPFAKMSGAGLGFTGGTLDKLASIPGFRTNLTKEEFLTNLAKHKIALIGQSKNLVPADQKIYALRDVTNLVDSIPLIASSIIAKKIATGADAILLDIKCGSGAFMKDEKSARLLAKEMIDISKYLHKDVKVEITNMNTPLGKAIGNKNEVLEAYHFLNNQFVSLDLIEIISSAAITMLLQAKIFNDENKALLAVKETLQSGKALAKFKEWIIAQGGDFAAIRQKDFWAPQYQKAIYATNDGYFAITSGVIFGQVAVELGAGRKVKGEKIDDEAGIMLNHKTGDKVAKNELLFTLYSSKPIRQSVINQVTKGFVIKDFVPKKSAIIAKID